MSGARTALARAVAVGIVVLSVVACAPASTGQLVTPPPAASASGAQTPSPERGAAGEPAEALPTPETLDRSFDDSDETRIAREALVARSIEPVVADERVVAAMRSVPRHSFVPTTLLAEAYDDHPLPIEAGQTISQPSLVALMTETLEIDDEQRVLEVGTGSGYQAAILAQLTGEVYSVEIIPELAAISRAVLDRVGAHEVEILRTDGYFGWQEHAPYDAIVVTAAPDHLPSPLVQQLLEDGGRMVIPIGPVGDVQTLWLVTVEGGEVEMQDLGEVQFVPFTRDPGS